MVNWRVLPTQPCRDKICLIHSIITHCKQSINIRHLLYYCRLAKYRCLPDCKSYSVCLCYNNFTRCQQDGPTTDGGESGDSSQVDQRSTICSTNFAMHLTWSPRLQFLGTNVLLRHITCFVRYAPSGSAPRTFRRCGVVANQCSQQFSKAKQGWLLVKSLYYVYPIGGAESVSSPRSTACSWLYRERNRCRCPTRTL